MPDGVRELRPPRRLQVRHQVELAAVIGAVASPAERDHTEPVSAPTQRAWDQVQSVRARGSSVTEGKR